jgi:iron complex transport system permease protein
VIGVLSALIVAGFAVTLMVGQTFYPPGDVARVVLGQDVPGASFTVGRLRLPRAVLAITAGMCFGLAGVTFQTMLRNPLASPDIIGISAGAGAAATFAIVVLSLDGAGVSVFAIAAGLGVALVIYALSYKGGVSGTRLILIGIGVSAMLDSVTSYILDRAATWDFQEAMRWLTGSLNGTSWNATLPVIVALAVLAPLLLGLSSDLSALQLGDDTASALGVRVDRTRLLAVVGAVGLIAFATAAAGPIGFVGVAVPHIARALVGPDHRWVLPWSAVLAPSLLLVADIVGRVVVRPGELQVGIVTALVGAPFFILLVRRRRTVGL